jgi:hypothetical protein
MPPPPKTGKPKSTGAVVFGAAGAVLMVVGAIGSALPWATISTGFYSASKGGLSGDGTITIVAAVIALAFFLVGIIGRARWPFIVGLVMSLIIAAVAIYDALDLGSGISVGIGLILCMVAGVLGVIAGIGGIASPRKTV